MRRPWLPYSSRCAIVSSQCFRPSAPSRSKTTVSAPCGREQNGSPSRMINLYQGGPVPGFKTCVSGALPPLPRPLRGAC